MRVNHPECRSGQCVEEGEHFGCVQALCDGWSRSAVRCPDAVDGAAKLHVLCCDFFVRQLHDDFLFLRSDMRGCPAIRCWIQCSEVLDGLMPDSEQVGWQVVRGDGARLQDALFGRYADGGDDGCIPVGWITCDLQLWVHDANWCICSS